MTHSSRDDASGCPAVRLDPIGLDRSERQVLSHSYGDDTALPVVPAGVFPLSRTPVEDLRREFEIEPATDKVAIARASVLVEAHELSIRLYILRGKDLATCRARLVGGPTWLDRTPETRDARHSRATRSARNTLSND